MKPNVHIEFLKENGYPIDGIEMSIDDFVELCEAGLNSEIDFFMDILNTIEELNIEDEN